MPLHGRIGVEPADQRHQLGFRDGRRQPMVERAHPDLGGGLGLAPHIGLAGRIVADQHHGEAGHQPLRRRQAPHLGRDAGAQLSRHRFAVDDARAHRRGLAPCSAVAWLRARAPLADRA